MRKADFFLEFIYKYGGMYVIHILHESLVSKNNFH